MKKMIKIKKIIYKNSVGHTTKLYETTVYISGKIQDRYYEIKGWNPLPIKGKFSTSIAVFDEWMEEHGYLQQFTLVGFENTYYIEK